MKNAVHLLVLAKIQQTALAGPVLEGEPLQHARPEGVGRGHLEPLRPHGQPERPRVQHHPRRAVVRAVRRVPDDRQAEGDAVEAELVAPPRRRLEEELGHGPAQDAVDAEKPEDSNSWKNGRSGATKTLFLSRYPK